MTPATLQEAEAAKRKLRERLSGISAIRGIGIATLRRGYGIKVNLLDQSARHLVPDDIDGVPVIVDVVGIISPY